MAGVVAFPVGLASLGGREVFVQLVVVLETIVEEALWVLIEAEHAVVVEGTLHLALED